MIDANKPGYCGPLVNTYECPLAPRHLDPSYIFELDPMYLSNPWLVCSIISSDSFTSGKLGLYLASPTPGLRFRLFLVTQRRPTSPQTSPHGCLFIMKFIDSLCYRPNLKSSSYGKRLARDSKLTGNDQRMSFFHPFGSVSPASLAGRGFTGRSLRQGTFPLSRYKLASTESYC